jgi:hypothetical protein
MAAARLTGELERLGRGPRLDPGLCARGELERPGVMLPLCARPGDCWPWRPGDMCPRAEPRALSDGEGA